LLAGTAHRRLPDLTSFIVAFADDGTKEKWVREYLLSSWGKQPSEDDIKRALRDKNLVEDAIVAGCVERDPIEVMTHYFSVEGKDIEDCLTRFDPSGAPATIAAIKQRVMNFAEKLKPIWVETAESTLEMRLIGERARLAALEVARALGFRVKDVEVRETISEHISRVRRFIDSLYNFGLDDQRKGAIHCAVVCEEILKFTIAFYRAVEYFDFRFESGISPTDATSLANDDHTIKRVRGQTLGRVLNEFHHLCAAYARGKQPPMLGDRGWMLEGLEQHCGKLEDQNDRAKQRSPMWAFIEWRNKAVHHPDELSPDDDLESLLKGVLSFLEWMRRPGRTGATQVYPAILHLNVLSTNRCGITTVKYELWERNSSGVALYTHQPISATAGVFYGMPRHERSTKRLWMDPVLFGSEVIERALRGGA
jgi:ribosomal protein L12E/L44/L45/RPP1/RPP2